MARNSTINRNSNGTGDDKEKAPASAPVTGDGISQPDPSQIMTSDNGPANPGNADNVSGSSAAEGKKEGKKVEMVSVPASIIEDMKKMQEKIARMEETEKKLLYSADLGRLEKYDKKHANGEVVHRARMRFLDDRPIVAWKLVQDDVFVDSRGVYHETQTVELFFGDSSDKESVTMSYLESERRVSKKEGEIIRRSKNAYGGETVTIRLDSGKEYELDISFIN